MRRILIAAVLALSAAPLAAGQAVGGKQNQEADKKQLTNLVRYLMTSREGSTEETLRKLDEECAKAMIQGNLETLDLIEADDFTFTAPDGSIMNKAQDLETIKSGDMVYDSIALDEVSVRVFGEAGVVTGRANVKGRYKTFDISGLYRYTVTFVRQDGRWRAVASQMTRIRG